MTIKCFSGSFLEVHGSIPLVNLSRCYGVTVSFPGIVSPRAAWLWICPRLVAIHTVVTTSQKKKGQAWPRPGHAKSPLNPAGLLVSRTPVWQGEVSDKAGRQLQGRAGLRTQLDTIHRGWAGSLALRRQR